MNPSAPETNRPLILSALIAGGFAVAGIVWGLWANSLMILFDGAYSLVSLVLSLLSVYAARLLQRPANRRYPFGMVGIEPLVIAVKGLVIGVICLLSLASAIQALLSGGRETDADMALAFAAVSVVACLATWLYLCHADRQRTNGLIQAERSQWLMDTVLSGAVVIGFSIAVALQHLGQEALSHYADPIMVLLVSGYFLLVPARMTWQAVRELLLAAPPRDLAQAAEAALNHAGLQQYPHRVTKVGAYLILDVDLPVARAVEFTRLRFRLYRELSALPVRPVVFLNAETAHSGFRELPTGDA